MVLAEWASRMMTAANLHLGQVVTSVNLVVAQAISLPNIKRSEETEMLSTIHIAVMNLTG